MVTEAEREILCPETTEDFKEVTSIEIKLEEGQIVGVLRFGK